MDQHELFQFLVFDRRQYAHEHGGVQHGGLPVEGLSPVMLYSPVLVSTMPAALRLDSRKTRQAVLDAPARKAIVSSKVAVGVILRHRGHDVTADCVPGFGSNGKFPRF